MRHLRLRPTWPAALGEKAGVQRSGTASDLHREGQKIRPQPTGTVEMNNVALDEYDECSERVGSLRVRQRAVWNHKRVTTTRRSRRSQRPYPSVLGLTIGQARHAFRAIFPIDYSRVRRSS